MLSGDKLKFLRIYHDISQKDMASAIDVSDRWVRKIESGDEIPTEELYQKWLDCCYGKLKPKRKTTKTTSLKNNNK